MRLVQKAYRLNPNKFPEPWFVPDDVVHADTAGKAKKQLFSILDEGYGWLLNSGEEVTFLNIPVLRDQNYDKFEIFGEVKTKMQIEYDTKVRSRRMELEDLLAANPDAFCYIKKGGTYWCPNSSGYTDYRMKAGIYPIKEAVSIVKSSSLDRNESVVLIDKEEHNRYLQGHINDLKTRLI